MVLTIASFKGGVSKTTSAVHLSAVLSERGTTALIDGDPNRSATGWNARGRGLPFPVLDVSVGASRAREYQNLVIDTKARTDREDLAALVDGCDLLVVPTTPDILAIDALEQTLETLESLRSRYRILLTIVPPKPSKAGEQVQSNLKRGGWPVYKAFIHRLAAFQKAALLGCLVKDVPSDSRAEFGWNDYIAVGREMTHERSKAAS